MNLRTFYSSISRRHKKLLFVFLDIMFLPASLWSSFALRFSEPWPYERMVPYWWMFVLIPVIGVYVFSRFGLYRAVVRFMGHQVVMSIVKGVLLLTLLLYAMAHVSGVTGFPRSIPINFAIISCLYVAGTRYLVKVFYQSVSKKDKSKENILIYGAGEAGAQFSLLMTNSHEFNPIGFVDDDATLHGQTVNGIVVYNPKEVDELLERFTVSRIVLAVPAASKPRRKQIIEMLKPLGVHVQTLPSLAELAAGSSSLEQLREIDFDDLLGRDVIKPNAQLLTGAIAGKVVMVTGAGGSIGSELCRQIAELQPATLIMYDNSEYALYAIDSELRQKYGKIRGTEVDVIPILGTVLDGDRLSVLFAHFSVQTIFHAAAYKHVPMVEHNVLEGIKNNIFGTRTVAQLAIKYSAERFILVSTDKAVRPTNVMGATKRVAEQVVQNLAESSSNTILTMVRFGNVLGSSGSVVPLFRSQIESGGPVTVTHKEVTRYFMSIPEAAQLVVQAGAMAAGGEVFVLDMGKPVRIYDLAKNMIQLSGMKVLDDASPDGDIAIKITGLRPGEKLYEELLIGGNVEATEHARIMKAQETHLDSPVLERAISSLWLSVGNNDIQMARDTLMDVVQDYNPAGGFVDYLYSHDENK